MLSSNEWTAELTAERDLLERHYLGLRRNRPAPVHLHHYTKLDSLRKIVTNRTLRLYDALTMEGDPEEVTYPMRVVCESIQPYYGRLLYPLTAHFNPLSRRRLEGKADLLVCCFCEVKESPHMWTDYASNGSGVSIVLTTAELVTPPDHNHGFFVMMYQSAEYEKMLHEFYEYLSSRDWEHRFGFQEAEVLVYESAVCLLQTAFSIKRPQFEPEQEWRLMQPTLQPNECRRDERGRKYIEIPLLPEYLAEVVLGPRSQESESTLREFLRGTPYADVPISRSILEI
jgi:Protein of unknown function (DUF2971)